MFGILLNITLSTIVSVITVSVMFPALFILGYVTYPVVAEHYSLPILGFWLLIIRNIKPINPIIDNPATVLEATLCVGGFFLAGSWVAHLYSQTSVDPMFLAMSTASLTLLPVAQHVYFKRELISTNRS